MDAESLREIGVRSPEADLVIVDHISVAPQSTPLGQPPGANPAAESIDQTPTSSKGKTNKKATSAKRKGNRSTTPRSERLKSKMANLGGNEQMITDQPPVQPPPNGLPNLGFDIKAYLDQQFSSVKTDLKETVKDIAEQVSTNTKKISEIDSRLDSRIAAAVNQEMQKITKEIDQLKNGRERPQTMALNVGDDTAYWRSRRSVRIWPIKCRDNDLWGSVGDFFFNVLLIPKSNLNQTSVESIRRIGAGKRRNPSKIHDEVLVTFCDCTTRDMIFSYASNLARYKDNHDRPGIRLDIPDQLKGTFSDLERYGAGLRKKLGPELKRNIKFEDGNKSMYIDVLFPGDTTWTKIPHTLAKEQLDEQDARTTVSARERLSSINSMPSPQSDASPTIPQSDTLRRFSNSSSDPPQRWGPKI